MKNKYKIIACLALLCSVIFSCNDFLDEDAKGTLTPATFFQNEAEANLALNGLQSAVGGAGTNEHLGTDVGVYGRNAAAGAAFIGIYNYNSTTGQVRNAWNGHYNSIKNANLVIAGVERSNLSDEVKGSTLAQAYFYRAFQYFALTRIFGDVPYWRQEADINVVSYYPNTDADIIQTEMLADLELAISSGYLSKARWNQNNGRPTEWAVRMLKAYIHVWRGEWPQARTELIEITTKSPHDLNDDYANMWREGQELNDELIFAREFLQGIVENVGHRAAHFNAAAETAETATAMSELGVYSRSAFNCVRTSFADTYDDNDNRKKYNIWESQILEDGVTEVNFRYVYIPKLIRGTVPKSDPLMTTPSPDSGSNEPARIFSISDAYLLLAEAEFMINGATPAALAAINYKRAARVGLPDYDSTLTIQDIRNERGWELLGEGFWGRKYDLIRWGILESTIEALPTVEANAGAYSRTIERAQEEKDIFAAGKPGQYRWLPIPYDDILISEDIGGELKQNPLWVD